MATQDISRFLLHPKKHYSGLHLQQGRVIVDSDWNERAGIEAEELRQTLLDIACSGGTPNDGLAISGAADGTIGATNPFGTVNTYDFTVGAGSYYVGGLRVALEADETFLGQNDWLQLDYANTDVPARVTAPEVSRWDLVYLCTWEQPVTAVEDSELQEVALGGRDTSVRIKRMRRFMTKVNTASDCDTAFTALIADLNDSGRAAFNAATGELESAGRLQVTTNSTYKASEDPCAEPTASGYIGAENQTIRVELRTGSGGSYARKLIWGFDNASKLYRVKVNGTNVAFLTPPGDVASMPRAGQIVEFLPWGAKLPNNEKVAETQGLFSVVTSSYSPISNDIEVELIAELGNWNTWLANHGGHHNTDDPVDEREFLFMRVWDQGAKTVDFAVNALTSYGPAETIPLGETGLSVTVTTDGIDGDYWIIAARPSTPDVVTPWDLGDGAPPHGPRRFYAPLGLVESTYGTPSTYVEADCRKHLRQLCEGGACTVTVGDGKKSFGQFNSLQEAVNVVGNGSKICMLPGTHEGNTLIEDKVDLVIEGCGFRTMLKNPQPTATNTDFTAFDEPVISIVNCTNVTLRDLTITGYSSVAVEVSVGDQVNDECKDIHLDRLLTWSTGGYTTDQSGVPTSWWLPASGIVIAGASQVEITNCDVIMDNVIGLAFAVVLGGDALSMRDCRVLAPTDDDSISAAISGINVRSGSRNVEIIGCEITGGKGHGIALGHGRVFTAAETPSRKTVLTENPRIGLGETSVPEGGNPTDCECENEGGATDAQQAVQLNPLFLPAGAVEDVRIYDNHISKMGYSGISTSLFWPTIYDSDGDGLLHPVFIVVNDIEIARNVIEGNVRRYLQPGLFIGFNIAVGGVVLAASANAWIHENTIRDNGTVHVLTPICGVGVIAAMNTVIEDNQISGNSAVLPDGSDVLMAPGLRGGVAIYEATSVRTRAKTGTAGEKPSFPSETAAGEVPVQELKDWTDATSHAAVIVRGNEVSQPLGKALWIRRGFGHIAVTGNSLESYGDPVTGISLPKASFCWDSGTAGNGSIEFPASGACVEIINYAKALDYAWTSEVVEKLLWTDVTASVVDGGDVLVSGNTMRLQWDRLGGIAASVVISSLSSVVFESNMSTVETGSLYQPATGTNPMLQFYQDILTGVGNYATVFFNVYVGALSGAQVVGCRMIEPQYDCLYSAVLGPPLSPVELWTKSNENGTVMASNIGSHRLVGSSNGTEVPAPATVDPSNALVYLNEILADWNRYSVDGGNDTTRKVSVVYT